MHTAACPDEMLERRPFLPRTTARLSSPHHEGLPIEGGALRIKYWPPAASNLAKGVALCAAALHRIVGPNVGRGLQRWPSEGEGPAKAGRRSRTPNEAGIWADTCVYKHHDVVEQTQQPHSPAWERNHQGGHCAVIQQRAL